LSSGSTARDVIFAALTVFAECNQPNGCERNRGGGCDEPETAARMAGGCPHIREAGSLVRRS
jgi:hypothetical protein